MILGARATQMYQPLPKLAAAIWPLLAARRQAP